jgi:dipeptidase E
MAPDLLLLSSSALHGYAPFEFARDELQSFFGRARTVHFVPHALADRDSYTAAVRERLAPYGVEVLGIEDGLDPRAAIDRAEILFIGGGNTFRLLDALQRLGLIEPIRRRALAGDLRFLGSSAGTNMACPTLRTTNDMPIVQPRSFEALGLVPFQINPHYVDPDPGTTHKGETREQRIREFLEENDVPVVGLREGSYLRRRGDRLTLGGVTGARVFLRDREPEELRPGADLSWLLAYPARYDVSP